ncbi:MAG: hypothetical protein WBA97_23645 [Actinophytocola sp.]|uniref:tetratricopeptide repeat protein n=1 Tax=Actinophytocola sp. TaxID=1872138 RepID=UPI003C738F3F
MDRPPHPEPDHEPSTPPEGPGVPDERQAAEAQATQENQPDEPAVPEDDRPTVAGAGQYGGSAPYGQHVTESRPTFYDPDATPSYGTRVPRPPKPADPLAVAVGNASLLGVGYVLLGRKGLAVATVLVTVLFLFLLLSVTPTLWFEFVIVAWWVAVIVHGWVLARRRPRPDPVRGQRFVALGAAVPVLLVFGLLRFDAAGLEQDTADARADGDCAAALDATGALWFGHRVADAPLTERAGTTTRACDQLRTAGRKLDEALDGGDADSLAAGFRDLRKVLAGLPGHEEMVRSTVDRFVEGLPVEDACDTKALTDRLAKEKPRGVLSGAAEVVPRLAPAAIVECADFFADKSDWQSARRDYQQFLDQYPDHDLAPKAQTGLTVATQAIELANVRTLLTPAAGSVPAYCDKPAPYSGAKPYVPNAPNRALVYGNDAHTGKIPPGWRATDAADAVIVVCAGETAYGTPVQTCPYESKSGLSPFGYTDVTFHRIAIPLRVFEVRTGKLVAQFNLEIGGASCPAVLEYTSYGYTDLGPPSQVYVAASVTDVQGAFRPLLVP